MQTLRMIRLVQMKRVVSSSSGFSLISTIVGIGVAAIVGILVAAVLSEIFGLMGRGSAMSQAQSSAQLVSSVVLNRKACNDALRSADPFTKLTYGAPEQAAKSVNVGNVVAWSSRIDPATGKLTPSVLAKPDLTLGYGARIDKIQFREDTELSRGNVNLPNPAYATNNALPKTLPYNTFKGSVYISYKYDATHSNKPGLYAVKIAERAIPVTLAVDATTNTIDFCQFDNGFAKICADLGGTPDSAGNCTFPDNKVNLNLSCAAVSATCPASGGGCSYTAMLKGINPDGSPKCECVKYCTGSTPGSGPNTSSPPLDSPPNPAGPVPAGPVPAGPVPAGPVPAGTSGMGWDFGTAY